MGKTKSKLISILILFLFLVLSLFVQPVFAQETEEEPGLKTGMFIHWFEITPETNFAEIDYFNETTEINIHYQDLWNWWIIPFAVPWLPSTWNPANWFQNFNDPLPENSQLAIRENLHLSVEFLDGDPEGWNVYLGLTDFDSYLGTTQKNITLFISIDGPISKRYEEIKIVGYMGDPEAEEFVYVGHCNILLKAENFNRASLFSDEKIDITAAPHTIITYPIVVENKGYFRDKFVFTATPTKEGDLRGWQSSIPGSVVLDPGESTTVYLNVKTPDVFYVISDINIITVDVFSQQDLNRPLDSQEVSVRMQGFYFSPLVVFIVIITILILIILIGLVKILKNFFPKKSNKDKKKEKKSEKETLRKIETPKKIKEKNEERIKPKTEIKPNLAVKISPDQLRKEKAIEKARRLQEKQKRQLGR